MSRPVRANCIGPWMVLVVAGAGCGIGDDGSVGNGIQNGGACVHEYREPILNLDSVTEATTGDAVAVVHLSEIAVDGMARTGTTLVQAGRPQSNVTADGSGNGLDCTVPCGFGSAAGTWTFTVSAEGRVPTDVTVEAAYETFVGGCPSYEDGGTRFDVVLEAE